MTTLRVHLDFLSPYAYLAWTQLPALAARHGAVLEPVPVLFGAMLDAFGTIGPAEVPIKRRYVYEDVIRKARLLGVPLSVPPAHPFHPILALRVATAARAERKVIDALFGAAWGEGRSIEGPEAVREVLLREGLDPGLVDRASEHATKAALAEATRTAIEAGIFGVPTIEVAGERFWGLDSLPSLEAFLRGEDPITPELRALLQTTVVGIQRKRA
jgi:2-hydroxychromene-2-carboxylate isomerase